jgi:hypothetical protein
LRLRKEARHFSDGNILGDDHQGVRVADDHPFAARVDQALALPFAEHAADGEEGGSCQLGDFLPGEREVDEDAPLFLSACLRGKTQERTRSAPLFPMSCVAEKLQSRRCTVKQRTGAARITGAAAGPLGGGGPGILI